MIMSVLNTDDNVVLSLQDISVGNKQFDSIHQLAIKETIPPDKRSNYQQQTTEFFNPHASSYLHPWTQTKHGSQKK